MGVFTEKMSWLIVLILIIFFIVFALLFKDVIIEKLKFLVDVTVVKKYVP
ncbi:MAG: hypothetical protein RMJ17_04205 [Candidatus Aenigmarchaeota archaeon]|nr:hypothetical protein [Candidatus Aenigmarchaeota archaeon]MDW8149760.1 hypothetical protein [Candidatus Aenigmarchaeota archaeon]